MQELIFSIVIIGFLIKLCENIFPVHKKLSTRIPNNYEAIIDEDLLVQYVYLIHDNIRNIYKIGQTRDLDSRIKDFHTVHPGVNLSIVYYKKVKNSAIEKTVEDKLHDYFINQQVNRYCESINSSKAAGHEWFYLSNPDISYIKRFLNDEAQNQV